MLGLAGLVVLAAGEYGGELELLVETTTRLVGCPACGVVATPHGGVSRNRSRPPASRTLREGTRSRTPSLARTWHGAASWATRPWHDSGMVRIRLSTTVDASLLEHARNLRSGTTDAALVDEALAALLARYRSAEVDASYAAYDKHPLSEPDEWGDLASFRRAAASS